MLFTGAFTQTSRHRSVLLAKAGAQRGAEVVMRAETRAPPDGRSEHSALNTVRKSAGKGGSLLTKDVQGLRNETEVLHNKHHRNS